MSTSNMSAMARGLFISRLLPSKKSKLNEKSLLHGERWKNLPCIQAGVDDVL